VYKEVQAMKRRMAAVKAQKHIRRFSVQKKWFSFKQAITILQSLLRKHRAKAVLKLKRSEAKDVGKLQQSNEALKAEIENLRAMAVEENRRLKLEMEREMREKAAAAQNHELGLLKAELDNTLKLLEMERAMRKKADEKLSSAEEKGLRLAGLHKADLAKLVLLEQSLAEAKQALQQQLEESTRSSPARRAVHVADQDAPVSPVHEADMLNWRVVNTPGDSERGEGNRPKSFSRQQAAAIPAEKQGVSEEHKKAVESLDKEKKAKKVLEEEVDRLRAISLEYKAQLEAFKKNGHGHSNGHGERELPLLPSNGANVLASPEKPSAQPAAGEASAKPYTARRSTLTLNAISANAKHTRTASGSETISTEAPVPAPPSPTPAVREEAAKKDEPIKIIIQKIEPRRPSAAPPSSSKARRPSLDKPVMTTPTERRNSVAVAKEAAPPAAPNPELLAAMGSFEKNLESVRTKMKMGVKVQYWEGTVVVGAEATLRLDPSHRLFSFETNVNRTGFTFFQARLTIKPVSLSEIVECLPGAEVGSGMEQTHLLTVVSKSQFATESRIFALKFVSKDQRNIFLTGLRTVLADVHISSPSASMLKTVEADLQTGAKQKNSNPMVAKRKGSILNTTISQDAADDFSSASAGGDANASTATAAAAVKELGETQAQLAAERTAYERMMIQMLVLANDLNDREEQIAGLRKKEESYEQTIVDRDNMFKQDCMVRMQLGRRLEQVLMDKEEAFEQLEQMKEQLEALKAVFSETG
jgi:hypothetical protein